MSVKANKCVYYHETNIMNDTCIRYDEHCTCCILLGDKKCNMFYPKYKYREDNKKQVKIEIDELRNKLSEYKTKNNLTFFKLGLDIGTSYTTLRSFLLGHKIKRENVYKINKYLKRIKL